MMALLVLVVPILALASACYNGPGGAGGTLFGLLLGLFEHCFLIVIFFPHSSY
jgi:hypothetical protein